MSTQSKWIPVLHYTKQKKPQKASRLESSNAAIVKSIHEHISMKATMMKKKALRK